MVSTTTTSLSHHDDKGSSDENYEQHQQHEQNDETTALEGKDSEEFHPRRSPILGLFRMVSFITTVAAILMASGQFMRAFLDEDLGPIDSVLRGYNFLFCVLVVLNETNLYPLDSKLLRLWIFRVPFTPSSACSV
jgi:hypothetical protein